jgi:hypothetical protein
VITVPGQEKVTLVIRGESKMQSIADRIVRHDPVLNVSLDYVPNCFINKDEWDVLDETERVIFAWILTFAEFIENGNASDESIFAAQIVPPLTCPLTPGDHLRVCPDLVIEAWDRCLDINERTHNEEIVRPVSHRLAENPRNFAE